MPTLEEVDEALNHLREIPADERGAAWAAYLDSLLEQRKLLTRVNAPTFSDSLR